MVRPKNRRSEARFSAVRQWRRPVLKHKTLADYRARASHKILSQGRCDPLFFSQCVLGGPRPWRRQADILRALRDGKRVAVRSGHGVGKTWIAARAALWFLYSHPGAVVLTTAPTHRQVRSILWAEIRKQARNAAYKLGGRITETGIRLDDDWFALGLATDEPERFQGYHAERLLLVFDEAPGVSPEIYEAARGLLTSRHARILLIGNPTEPSGPFYNAFRTPGWKTLHIPCTACPNVRLGRVTHPSLVTAEWVEAQRAEWGENSPAFRARVLGEFPSEHGARLIPLAWIHAAQARDGATCSGSEHRLGVDVARYGSDRTALAVANDCGVLAVRCRSGLSTMETAGWAIASAREFDVAPEAIAIDDAGVGGGVTDRLREQGWSVRAINGANRPDNPAFANTRAEIYWRLRTVLSPENDIGFGLPREPELARQLSALTYGFDSRGRIRLEAKDQAKAALGVSPDMADACALTMALVRAGGCRFPRMWDL